ncbi:DUF732 domain-containing protein [Mycobacterium colombiense]|uniref:DUF732 domain-containing protein n=1 Tax=Mycobacterium colombiense TaxID=339268 RepID=UPI00200A5820|nr:DUF732 domain-containing protein [Mycobacterium colombiense]MCK8647104.1 DUF732 domain-containing protein [Mycobacterium colombiense]
MTIVKYVGAAMVALSVLNASVVLVIAPPVAAAPAPEVEYAYDVMVRRHYNFQSTADAIQYGRGICDKVSGGRSYSDIMADVRNDVVPNDEFASSYLVSYAVNLLCPALIWELRNGAAHYRPPSDGT